MRDRAVRVGDARADDEVASAAIREAQRSAGVGGDGTADGRAVLERWIQRQKLAVLAENALQLRKTHASFDSHGQVGGLVLDNTIEACCFNGQVQLPWWH